MPAADPNMVNITARVRPETARRLRLHCAHTGQRLSAVVDELLGKHLPDIRLHVRGEDAA